MNSNHTISDQKGIHVINLLEIRLRHVKYTRSPGPNNTVWERINVAVNLHTGTNAKKRMQIIRNTTNSIKNNKTLFCLLLRWERSTSPRPRRHTPPPHRGRARRTPWATTWVVNRIIVSSFVHEIWSRFYFVVQILTNIEQNLMFFFQLEFLWISAFQCRNTKIWSWTESIKLCSILVEIWTTKYNRDQTSSKNDEKVILFTTQGATRHRRQCARLRRSRRCRSTGRSHTRRPSSTRGGPTILVNNLPGTSWKMIE